MADAISKINGWCSGFIVWSFQLTQVKAIAIQKTAGYTLLYKNAEKFVVQLFAVSLECVIS